MNEKGERHGNTEKAMREKADVRLKDVFAEIPHEVSVFLSASNTRWNRGSARTRIMEGSEKRIMVSCQPVLFN